MTPLRSNPHLRAAVRVLAGLAAVSTLVACPGRREDDDGGVPDDGGFGAPIELDFHVEGGGGTGDWELRAVAARLDVLDIHSDVGPVGDPHLVALGTVTFLPESEVSVATAPPGTYSQMSAVLAPSGADPGWTISLARDSGQTLVVRSNRTLSLSARCDVPSTVEHDDALALSISVDGDSLVAAVDAAAIAQMPGSSTLDDADAPTLVDAIESVLVDTIALRCD